MSAAHITDAEAKAVVKALLDDPKAVMQNAHRAALSLWVHGDPLKAFKVSVKTPDGRQDYKAISRSSCTLVDEAIDRFGPCAVSVCPA